ncbi:response regulator [Magnetococcales bacterium HHB-1]
MSMIQSNSDAEDITRVLLIDDQTMTAVLLRRLLKEEQGLELTHCIDPRSAQDAVRRQLPTVILLDIVMPGIDGLTLLRQFRDAALTKKIPVIMLSTEEDPVVKAEAFALGANDYLIKLPDRAEMVARIRYHAQAFHALIRVQQASEKDRRIFQLSRDAIFLSEVKDGRIIDCNKAAEQLIGLSKDRLVGQPQNVLYPPEYREKYRTIFADALFSGQPINQDIYIQHHSGQQVLTDVTLVSFTQGEQTLIQGMYRDISERQQLLQSLRETLEIAESANRAKSQFLANMSHEIRSPMNAIIGMTDLVLETTLTKDQEQYLTIVQQSAESLLGLLNSILDFSKIEAGKLELEYIPFNLRKITEGACETLALQADKKRLELTIDIEPDIPTVLMGDPTRLRQIIINLVNNAIKFTSKGEINFTASLERNNLQNLYGVKSKEVSQEIILRFAVIDTGIGIPVENQEQIFENFSQADGSTTRQYGGTGLGLAITKRLVELMNGSIWVESRENHGSRFYFTSQFAIPPASENIDKVMPSYPLPDLTRVRILTVDGHITSQNILRKILKTCGADVHAANDEMSAMIEIKKGQQNRAARFDLVLFDCRVAKEGGLHFAEQLQQHAPNIPAIVLLPIHHRQFDVDDFRRHNVHYHLIKPIRQAPLLASISHLLDAQQKKALEAHPPVEEKQSKIKTPVPDKKVPRVLVVEDILANRILAKDILVRAGFKVLLANNGREGLATLQQQSVDVVLMDIQMPELDGLEAMRLIRQGGRPGLNAEIPLIAVTAHALKEEEEKCRQAGADDIVTKPYKAAVLIGAIKRVLMLHGVEDKPKTSNHQSDTNYLNDRLRRETTVLAAVRDQDDTIIQKRGAFLKAYPKVLQDLNQALEQRDCEIAEQEALWIKQEASHIGAGLVRNKAFKLVLTLRNSNLTQSWSLFKDLEHELSRVERALKPSSS